MIDFKGRVAQARLLRVPHPSRLCSGGDVHLGLIESNADPRSPVTGVWMVGNREQVDLLGTDPVHLPT